MGFSEELDPHERYFVFSLYQVVKSEKPRNDWHHVHIWSDARTGLQQLPCTAVAVDELFLEAEDV